MYKTKILLSRSFYRPISSPLERAEKTVKKNPAITGSFGEKIGLEIIYCIPYTVYEWVFGINRIYFINGEVYDTF